MAESLVKHLFSWVTFEDSSCQMELKTKKVDMVHNSINMTCFHSLIVSAYKNEFSLDFPTFALQIYKLGSKIGIYFLRLKNGFALLQFRLILENNMVKMAFLVSCPGNSHISKNKISIIRGTMFQWSALYLHFQCLWVKDLGWKLQPPNEIHNND